MCSDKKPWTYVHWEKEREEERCKYNFQASEYIQLSIWIRYLEKEGTDYLEDICKLNAK